MSINVKKYTKDQMEQMVEEAAENQEAAGAEAAAYFKAGVKLDEENEKLRGEIGTLTEKLAQMNGEAITREDVIANLKADADALRNKLADTEAALGRANAEITYSVTEKNELNAKIKQLDGEREDWAQRSVWQFNHPWRNLLAWIKRKMVRHD